MFMVMIFHLCRPIDIGHHESVYASVVYEVSSHSDGPDHTAWHTNPDENPYHPMHFDDQGNYKDPKADFYCPTTDADNESNKES